MGLNMGAAASDPVLARDLAVLAEGLGYDSLWVGDHPILPSPPRPESPFPAGYAFSAPFLTLAFLAGHTRRTLLATGVVLVPQRHPVHLAKEVATLDRLSGGRVVFGIGVGYLPEEFRAVGVPMAGRGRRTDEYLAAMQALWQGDAPSFHGDFVAFDGIDALPAPTRPAGPPIVVGGHSDAALARAAGLGEGWLGWSLRPDQAGRKVDRLRTFGRPAGRGAVEVSVMPSERLGPSTVAAYASAGVDRLVVIPSPSMDASRLLQFVERNAPAEVGATAADP
jgi:probable F420-dependent oxidoreductase